MQRIVIQGDEGSYSHAAALWYFGEGITVVSCATFAEVFNAVARGAADAAMVPIGNSYAGPVREVCRLLKESNLVVTGTCQRLIRHCLMALPGQTLEHIRRVRSHPQALMQCDVFLSGLGVEIVVAPDTAGSAKLIREQVLYGVAAIASAHAARIYQLAILAEDIQVRADNTTCFVILRRAEALVRESSGHLSQHKAARARGPHDQAEARLAGLDATPPIGSVGMRYAS